MNQSKFSLIPSIVVQGGQTPMPPSGPMLSEVTQTTPKNAAMEWLNQNVSRLLIIDADAQAGTGDNHEVIAAAVKAANHRALIEVSGGVRDAASLDRALGHLGHVVADASIIDSPEALALGTSTHGDRFVIELKVRDGAHVVAPGASIDGRPVTETIIALDGLGVTRYYVTDVAHHDHWKHGNLHLMQTVCAVTPHLITCGAGVKSLEDIHQLVEIGEQGLEGAVIGHALFNGAFMYADAQAAVEARYDPYEWGPAQP